MNRSRRRLLGTLVILPAVTVLASRIGRAEEEFYTDAFVVHRPWSPGPAGIGEDAPVYLEMEAITREDRLIGASSQIADAIELVDANGALQDGIVIPASEPHFSLEDKGAHLMLRRLRYPLVWRQAYPLDLRFERVGEVHTLMWIGEH
jgi:copper(I)-binding protein